MAYIQRIKKRIIKDKSLIIKLFSTAITRGLSAVGTFIFNFALAKFLNVSDFGYFMLAYTILVGLGFFVRFGMTFAIMRFASIMFAEGAFGKIKKLRRDVFNFSMLLSGVIGIIFILLRPFLSKEFFNNADVGNMLLVFAFALPFYSFQTLQSSFLKAYKKPELAPFFEIGATTFLTGAIVALLAWLGLHIDNLLASIVFFFSSVIIVFLGYLLLTKLIKKAEGPNLYKREEYTGFFSSLPDYALSDITRYLLRFSPIIILGIYAIDGKQLGLYSIANSISFIISFVLWIVNSVYTPHFASYFHQNKIKELNGLVRSATLYMLVVSIPVFLLIVCFPTPILHFFGKGYANAKYALIIMAIAQFINVLTGPVYHLLSMTGFERRLRNIVLVTAIITVVTSFLFVPTLGFMGAAIGASVGLILQNSLALYYSRKYIGIRLLKL